MDKEDTFECIKDIKNELCHISNVMNDIETKIKNLQKESHVCLICKSKINIECSCGCGKNTCNCIQITITLENQYHILIFYRLECMIPENMKENSYAFTVYKKYKKEYLEFSREYLQIIFKNILKNDILKEN